MTITRGSVLLFLGALLIGMFVHATPLQATIVSVLTIAIALGVFFLRHFGKPDLIFAIIGVILGIVLAVLGISAKVGDPVLALILLCFIV